VLLAGPTGLGLALPLACFVLGNLLGWIGVRRLYLRERRNVERP
jgi:hypothetical protein